MSTLMIELARFRQEQPARLMERTLTEQSIAAAVQHEGDAVVLYVLQAEQFQAAKMLLDGFLANPLAPRFQSSAWAVSEPVALGDGQPPLLTGNWWHSRGPLVKLVFVASIAIFLSPYLLGSRVYEALMFPAELSVLGEQPWRLLTPALLHWGPLHIIFNLLWWLDLGRVIERYQSGRQLLLISVLTAAASNLAQFFASGPAFGGLSGVVYGLLGYLWLYGKVNPTAGYGPRREVVLFMLAWLVVCMTGLVGNVANAAHVVGLLSGCVLGALTGLLRRPQSQA